MDETDNILVFEDACVEPPSHVHDRLVHVSLHLAASGLALVRLARGGDRTPLADAAEGLVAPSSGRVCYRGVDWQEMDVVALARARGRIGRVFEPGRWLSNLDVAENVTLARRHHDGGAAAAWRERAEALAREFGMDGLPGGRPAWARRGDLRRADWVRGFLGEPDLLLLERPELDAPEDAVPALIAAVAAARARGAAVVWITEETHGARDGLDDARRFVIANGAMEEGT